MFFKEVEAHGQVHESHYFSRRGHTNLITQFELKYGQVTPKVEVGVNEKLIFGLIKSIHHL